MASIFLSFIGIGSIPGMGSSEFTSNNLRAIVEDWDLGFGESLNVRPANRNEMVPLTFSHVRGSYPPVQPHNVFIPLYNCALDRLTTPLLRDLINGTAIRIENGISHCNLSMVIVNNIQIGCKTLNQSHACFFQF